ncbi:MAG TPA: SDR family oxidoreductase [Phycisphaerae bacterium]|nr:SDR family oxidoreductase [Phycisphaerae bacterium]
MSFTDKRILVTGASGNLGKAVVTELRRLGAEKVIAATRTPGKNQELVALGVEEREADFDRPETLQKAFAGVDRLLLISTDSLHAPEVRIKQHRAAIQAALSAEVKHIAYTSLPNAHPTTGPSVPDDHFWTEVALFESGLDWTILRNNLYAEVILRFAQFALKTGKLISATGSQGRSYVTRQDCAKVAAAALLNSTGKAIYDVTGPASVTHEQVASLLSRFSGKSIQHVNVAPEEVEKGLMAAGIPQFAARSVRELDEEAARGYQAILSPVVKDLTGEEPTSLEDFLQVAIPAMVA